jgi:hypothetical protein
MSKPPIEELEAAESRLNSAFVLAVVAVVCGIGAGLWLRSAAIGRAATFLVPGPWKYLLWVLAAPFLALIPIPIVSTPIAVSPLSLKFLCSGQLRNEIRERMLAD